MNALLVDTNVLIDAFLGDADFEKFGPDSEEQIFVQDEDMTDDVVDD